MNQRTVFQKCDTNCNPCGMCESIAAIVLFHDRSGHGGTTWSASQALLRLGIAGKICFLYSVVIGAVTAIAGYDDAPIHRTKKIEKSCGSKCMCHNLVVVGGIVCCLPCCEFAAPRGKSCGFILMMSRYGFSRSGSYLRIIAGYYLPIGVASRFRSCYGCTDVCEKGSAVCGYFVRIHEHRTELYSDLRKAGAPALGSRSCIASVVSQMGEYSAVALFFPETAFGTVGG
jgi:hypothetical protein